MFLRHLVMLFVVGALLVQGTVRVAAQSPARNSPRSDQPARVDPKLDPLNRYVESATVDGIIVSITIDGTKIELSSAQASRIPKPRPSLPEGPDTVRLTLLGAGATVQTRVVRDPALIIDEGGGTRRLEKRTVNVALATPRPVDTLEVRVTPNGAAVRFDLSALMRAACRGRTNSPSCAGAR